MKTIINKDGYLCFKDTKRLVHRWVAYKKIYSKNSFNYAYPFSRYQVHHVDRNKLNNNPENLALMLRGKHRREHGIPSFWEKLMNLIFGR